MKIKICGLRDPENIAAGAALPIDMLGFIFYKKSPRFVGSGLEKWLKKNASSLEGKKRVGVFVNESIENVLNAVHDYQLDFVQLHGDDEPEYCAMLTDLWQATSVRRAEIIKAFRVDDDFDFSVTQLFAPFCKYFLFDTATPAFGGSGQAFDWTILERYKGSTPFILSGGIDESMASAIKSLNHLMLAGIDLNSRFETAPGIKDIDKIHSFISELRS